MIYKTEFFINEEKRTITCKMLVGMPYEYDYSSHTIAAIAVCGEEDTFDVEVGKKVAKAKAHHEYHKMRCDSARVKYFRLANEIRKIVMEYRKHYSIMRKINKELRLMKNLTPEHEDLEVNK